MSETPSDPVWPQPPAAMPTPGLPAAVQAPTPYGTSVPRTSGTRGLYTAAAVLNWVTLGLVIAGTFGFGVIAAAWFVPMTILIHRNAKGPYKHTALSVCTLLFCNLVSGILMLVDDSNRPPKPVA